VEYIEIVDFNQFIFLQKSKAKVDSSGKISVPHIKLHDRFLNGYQFASLSAEVQIQFLKLILLAAKSLVCVDKVQASDEEVSAKCWSHAPIVHDSDYLMQVLCIEKTRKCPSFATSTLIEKGLIRIFSATKNQKVKNCVPNISIRTRSITRTSNKESLFSEWNLKLAEDILETEKMRRDMNGWVALEKVNLERWVDDVRLLVNRIKKEMDKSEEEAREFVLNVWNFAKEDDFWRKQVRSPSNLKKNFAKIVPNMTESMDSFYKKLGGDNGNNGNGTKKGASKAASIF
jgi:hypothetical protein